MSIQQKNGSSKLLNSDVEKFQILYLKHFSKTLNNDEARSELTHLLRLLEIVYQPISFRQFEKFLLKETTGGFSDGAV